jgi:hypothetical protein
MGMMTSASEGADKARVAPAVAKTIAHRALKEEKRIRLIPLLK